MFRQFTLWFFASIALFSGCIYTDADVDIDVEADVHTDSPEAVTEKANEAIEAVNSEIGTDIPLLDAPEVVSEDPSPVKAEDTPKPVPFDIDCYDWWYVPGSVRVSVGYGQCDDKSAVLSASRIAQLTEIFLDVWEEREYPEIDAVRERLSRYTILAVHVEDATERSPELARLKYPDLYDEDPAAALEKMGDGDAFCFPNGNSRYVAVSDESKFFIVLGSHILVEGWVEIVVHEIAHAALHAGYGDADGGHKRNDVWLGHGPDTLLDAVLERFWD